MKTVRLLLVALLLGGGTLSSRAQYTVTSLDDSGPGTLREGIAASPSGGTINFAVTGTIWLFSGELAIGRNLTIVGPGANALTVSGVLAHRVFNISAGAQVNLSGLTIAHGYVAGTNSPTGAAYGGGILNSGILSVASCIIAQNSAVGADGTFSGAGLGGGVFSSGSLSLTSCVITTNKAAGGSGSGASGVGGGVYGSGTLTLTGCTLSQNEATGGAAGGQAVGGGLASDGALAMTNCTVAGNQARGGDNRAGADAGGGAFGGGVYGLSGSAQIVSCTFSSNSCSGGNTFFGLVGSAIGGGIAVSAGLQIMNTIVAGNTVVGSGPFGGAPLGPEVYSGVSSLGYNLIGQTNDSSGWVASDQTGSTSFPLLALLGPLQDNGGPTPTMQPQSSSVAIDKGRSFGLATDQRGRLRPVDLTSYPNAPGGDGSDIGACEVQAVAADIGLRAHDGTGVIKIACESGNSSSPLRIAKNGTTYGVVLVVPNHPAASKLRLQTSSGPRALMKLP